MGLLGPSVKLNEYMNTIPIVKNVLIWNYRIHFNFFCFEISWVCEEHLPFVGGILEWTWKLGAWIVVGVWISRNTNIAYIVAKYRTIWIISINGFTWINNRKLSGWNGMGICKSEDECLVICHNTVAFPRLWSKSSKKKPCIGLNDCERIWNVAF